MNIYTRPTKPSNPNQESLRLLSAFKNPKGPGNGLSYVELRPGDVRLTLVGKDGFGVCVDVHKKILAEKSRFFAEKLARKDKEKREILHTVEISECDDMEVSRLPYIFQHLGLEYDEKVLPSIGNEVLKAVVAQFNADQLLTERPHVSALVRESLIRRAKDFNIVLDDVAITHLSYGAEFSRAVEQKQVAQQEAERSKFVVMKADQERRAAVIRAEGESESAQLISDATAKAGLGLIELRRIEASREVAATLARSPNVAYLPGGKNNMLLALNPALAGGR